MSRPDYSRVSRKTKVRYHVGWGWGYSYRGQLRGPFKSSKEAGIEMRRELYFRRAAHRAESNEPMTWADKFTERDLAVGHFYEPSFGIADD